MMARILMGIVVAAWLAAPSAAHAQTPMSEQEWREWTPDPATLAMPMLDFEPDSNDIKSYKKYFYFSRPDTAFDVALRDLRECDDMSRGLATGNYYPDHSMTAPYGVGGVIGGALVGAFAQALIGSAEKRAARRVNMRRCMFFKGYARHGLSKELWRKFNFEEGSKDVAESDRQKMLAIQALVASSDAITAEDIGL